MSAPAATPPTWQALAQAYHAHHFRCPHCIAAGLRRAARCEVGVGLWDAYQSSLEGQP